MTLAPPTPGYSVARSAAASGGAWYAPTGVSWSSDQCEKMPAAQGFLLLVYAPVCQCRGPKFLAAAQSRADGDLRNRASRKCRNRYVIFVREISEMVVELWHPRSGLQMFTLGYQRLHLRRYVIRHV
jgi:hypothetical protein